MKLREKNLLFTLIVIIPIAFYLLVGRYTNWSEYNLFWTTFMLQLISIPVIGEVLESKK